MSYAYTCGYEARKRKWTLADNPYHYFWEYIEFHEWNEGWRAYNGDA